MRESPKKRSASLGDRISSYDPSLFTLSHKKDSPKTAIMMFHGTDETISALTFGQVLQKRKFDPVRIPVFAEGLTNADFIGKLKEIGIINPGIFLLEANYGSIASAEPNHELILFVLESIKPKNLVLCSGTDKCLEVAKEKYADAIREYGVKVSTFSFRDSKDPALSVILKDDRKFSADVGGRDEEFRQNSNFGK